MCILDDRHKDIVERERELLGRLLQFLRGFEAPPADVELVHQVLSDIEELFLLVIARRRERRCRRRRPALPLLRRPRRRARPIPEPAPVTSATLPSSQPAISWPPYKAGEPRIITPALRSSLHLKPGYQGLRYLPHHLLSCQTTSQAPQEPLPSRASTGPTPNTPLPATPIPATLPG